MAGLRNGGITYKTLCWQDGWAHWKPLDQVFPQPTEQAGRYKTILRRVFASLIDAVPLMLIGMICALIYTLIPRDWFFTPFLLAIFYYYHYIFRCQVSGGQTIGMWLANIRVIQLDGSGISQKQASIRIALSIIGSTVEAIYMFFDMSASQLQHKAETLSYWARFSLIPDYRNDPFGAFLHGFLNFISISVSLIGFICVIAVVRTMEQRKCFADVFK
jgi:hypothetical protein